VFGGAFFAGEALKVPGKSERQRVSEIVHGIGENRDAVGEDPPIISMIVKARLRKNATFRFSLP
jgi:hypothetical protein